MRVDRYEDARDFLSAAGPWLSADEVTNNVMLSVARSVADGTAGPKDRPYFAVVTDGAQLDCCGIQTPPHPLLVTPGTPRGWTALAIDAFQARGRLPGVIGPPDAAASFAQQWLRLAGGRADAGMKQRLHAIQSVNDALPVARGALREAGPDDRAIAVQWISAFAREATPDSPSEPEKAVDRLLNGRTLYFWDSDGPVAMCASAGGTGSVGRINLVYTPPRLRGRGYATAAVAALTRRVLASGRRHCCLYTDLANPISNRVYYRIGFRPVSDLHQYIFS